MATRPVPRSVVPLLAAAMAIFVLTVVIGILNGTDLVTIPQGPLLAHVHAGTLGWITLSVFAGAAWVLGGKDLPKAFVWTAIIAVVAYIVAFYFSMNQVRPWTGTLMVVVIIWFMVWAFGARKGTPSTVPKFGVLLASINLTIGGLLGVLLGMHLAGMLTLPEGIGAAHPAMMVAGYLVLAGVSFAEELLGGKGTEATSKPGIAQQVLLFLAGIFLALGLLLDIEPLLMFNLLFQIVGTGFVVVRLVPLMKDWSASPARYGATAVLFLIPATILLVVIIAVFIEKIEEATHLLLALDHLTFVGVLTNLIFGILLLATAARRSVMAWADQVVYWGMNLGLIAFALGLILEMQELKRIGTPIMGLAILLGLLTFAMRLSGGQSEQQAAPAE